MKTQFDTWEEQKAKDDMGPHFIPTPGFVVKTFDRGTGVKVRTAVKEAVHADLYTDPSHKHEVVAHSSSTNMQSNMQSNALRCLPKLRNKRWVRGSMSVGSCVCPL